MSVKLVKYCPLCGAANNPAEPFCLTCRDGELMGVLPEALRAGEVLALESERTAALEAQAAIWESENGAGAAAPATPAAPAGASAGLQADRGPNTLHVEGDTQSASLVLELVEQPELRFTIKESQSVGSSRDPSRSADVTLSGAPNLDYISSVHARFFRRGAQWYVQHLGATNFIKVDGTRFDKREEVPLHEGAVLVLSKTPFRVLLGGAG
jgi:hypothetical protein